MFISASNGRPQAAGKCPFHRADKSAEPGPAADTVQLSSVSGQPRTVSAAELQAVVEQNAGNPSRALQELHQTYGPTFQVQAEEGLLRFDYHPDTMRKVLVNTANREPKFEKSDLQTHGLARLMGEDNLFLADGQQWEVTRSTLEPFFSAKNLKTDEKVSRVGKILDRHLDQLDQQLGAQGKADVDLLPLLRKATLEVALREILGAELKPGELDRLHHAFEVVNKQVGEGWILPPSLTRNEKSQGEFEQARATLNEWAGELVDKNGQPDSPQDALDHLMGAENPETGAPFSRDRLRSEVVNLMLAGHETTANLLSWTLTDLARNPDKQTALTEQVEATVGKSTPTMDQLRELNPVSDLWRQQATEHPPNFLISRQALADTEIGPKDDPVPLKAGTTLIMSTELANQEYGRGIASGFAQSPSDTTVTVSRRSVTS